MNCQSHLMLRRKKSGFSSPKFMVNSYIGFWHFYSHNSKKNWASCRRHTIFCNEFFFKEIQEKILKKSIMFNLLSVGDMSARAFFLHFALVCHNPFKSFHSPTLIHEMWRSPIHLVTLQILLNFTYSKNNTNVMSYVVRW